MKTTVSFEGRKHAPSSWMGPRVRSPDYGRTQRRSRNRRRDPYADIEVELDKLQSRLRYNDERFDSPRLKKLGTYGRAPFRRTSSLGPPLLSPKPQYLDRRPDIGGLRRSESYGRAPIRQTPRKVPFIVSPGPQYYPPTRQGRSKNGQMPTSTGKSPVRGWTRSRPARAAGVKMPWFSYKNRGAWVR